MDETNYCLFHGDNVEIGHWHEPKLLGNLLKFGLSVLSALA
ncbi:MAG: hypothetical protein ACXVBE_06635 [Bdellovibrionota bacterium]